VCYSMLVLYEEAIAKVSQNQVSKTLLHEIDKEKIDKAQELFNYAKSLIVMFSEWDKNNLPNPEEYSAEDVFFIERANGLFVYAMNFILCHEFAHIELEHIEKRKQGQNSTSDILKFEKEADARAMELVLNGINDKTKLSAEIGVLMGLCCMLFFKQKSETTTHPATDDRIHKLIEKVNASNADPHWGIAVLAFKLWDDQFVKNFNWPKSVHDLKELYELIRTEIQNEKSSS
ncbi:MAG: phage exclusion protein Lit family protein, partial [Flavobacterium sp.]